MNKNNVIPIIVEIPKWSSNKYEYNIKTKKIFLDRVLYGANIYPGEYGFIENTLDLDGDPLDVLSLITYPTIPGCQIDIRILGMIKMIDDEEIDNKLIGVVNSDPRFNHIQKLEDIPKHLRDEIENFFLQYKVLQKKTVIIKGWGGIKEALMEIKLCKERYTKYNNILEKYSKDEIIKILNNR